MAVARSFSVDLSDPRMQQILGPAAPTAGKREVVQIAGDEPSGVLARMSLTAGKREVVVVFGDLFLTVDAYAVPGAPVVLHIICPRCRKHSTISGARKRIEFEPTAENPQRSAVVGAGSKELAELAKFGRLSVEKFECAWEIGGDKHVATAMHTGARLCRMKLAIDNNRAVEA